MSKFTFKGVDLSPFLNILEIKRTIGNERILTTEDLVETGVDLQEVSYGAKMVKGTIYQFTPLTTYCIYENIKKVDFRFGSRLFNFNSCSLLKSCAFYIIVGNFQGQFFHLKTTV